jgi:hypothetical protein
MTNRPAAGRIVTPAKILAGILGAIYLHVRPLLYRSLDQGSRIKEYKLPSNRKMSMRGALIVFEGCDRSGKTTQCDKLVKALSQDGVKSDLMKFPGRPNMSNI